jgi:hypothetical protein
MGHKMNRRTLLAGFAAAGAAALLPIEAFAATWVNLGSKTVSLLADHDTIRVGAGAGLFTDIRLKVAGNTVFIHSMKVTFSSGATHNVNLRFAFLPGSSSRTINLPGPARLIRKVDLVYSKLIGGGTAVVTLQGRKI